MLKSEDNCACCGVEKDRAMSKEREAILEIAEYEGDRATDEQVGAYLVTELDIAESKANGFNDDHWGKAQCRADAACLRRLIDIYEHAVGEPLASPQLNTATETCGGVASFEVFWSSDKKAQALPQRMYSYVIKDDAAFIFNAGYQAATAHYQPLLDAKDAEIARLKESRIYTDNSKAAALLQVENTTLKALLEQAREAFDLICTIEGESGASQGSVYKVASKTLAAINAASQNSQSFNGNQTCETSSDTTGEK